MANVTECISYRKQTIECQVDPDDSENLPVIFYHRKCCQYFTMKSALTKIEEERIKQFEALKARSEAIVSYENKVEERSTRSSESVLRDNNQTVLPKMCIFCKRNKYICKTTLGKTDSMCGVACCRINTGGCKR